MTAPTFSKKTDTAVDPSNVKYGAPDIKYIQDVLDATHATDRVQATSIENANTINTAQTISGNKSFQNQKLRIRNPADTFSYIINSSAITTADKNVTLPLITADDTLVTAAFAQTLTNKTIDYASNTLTNVAGTTATQTLTNKTINYSSNTLTGVMPNGEGKTIGGWAGGKSLAIWGFLIADAAANAMTVEGSENATIQAALTKSLQLITGAVSGNQTGWRTNNGNNQMSAQLRPRMKMKFKFNTLTSIQFFAGFSSQTGALVAASNKLANQSGFGLWVDSTVNNNLQIASNDGDATTDTVNLSGNPTADTTTFHSIEVGVNSSDAWYYSWDGAAATTIATEVPAAATAIYPYIILETRSAATKTFECIYWFYEYTNGG